MSFLKRRSDEQVPAMPVPAKFLRQPLVPVVPTRMSPKTCSLSVIVGKSRRTRPMPTLPPGMMTMFTCASFDPSGVVTKAERGALSRISPVLRCEAADTRAAVAEAGRTVAGRREVPPARHRPARRSERPGSARRPQHEVGSPLHVSRIEGRRSTRRPWSPLDHFHGCRRRSRADADVAAADDGHPCRLACSCRSPSC